MGPGEAAGALAVLFGAYFVRALSGFGSGLIAVPLLAQLHPLTRVVPAVMALDFLASLLIGRIGGKPGEKITCLCAASHCMSCAQSRV